MIPLTPPISPAPISSELYIERNQIKTESFSKLARIQRNPGDRWVGKITLPVMNDVQARDWLGFFDALDGFLGSFWLTHPDFKTALGAANGMTGTVVSAPKGDILASSGWTPSEADLLKRGDIIQVGNKMKRVVETVASDSAGEATIRIAPRFSETITAGTQITTIEPKGIFRLTDGFVSPQADELRLHSLSFAVEEVLP